MFLDSFWELCMLKIIVRGSVGITVHDIPGIKPRRRSVSNNFIVRKLAFFVRNKDRLVLGLHVFAFSVGKQTNCKCGARKANDENDQEE